MATRLLIIAEGATLAHVGRPLLVAEEAARRGWEVVFVRPQRYAWMTRQAAFEVTDLEAQAPEVFAARLASGSPLYDFATLDAYVGADRALFRKYRPDAVIGDFRLSLAVSARLESCAYVTLSNAYWSPFHVMNGAWPVPDLPLTRFMPIAAARTLFNLVRPLAFRMHAGPMRRLRHDYGLDSDVGLQAAYTDADLVCYCDFPGLFDLASAPPSHRVVGSLVWSPDVRVPDEWATLRNDLPTLYVTLGSSGQGDLLAPAVRALADQGYQVILSSAGKTMERIDHPLVHGASMVPGDAACALAAAVVCNGGSPTTQQALRAGRPVLGVPTNLDQFLNMGALEKRRVGRILRSDRFRSRSLTAAVAGLLQDGTAERARTFLGDAERAQFASNDAVAARVLDLTRTVLN